MNYQELIKKRKDRAIGIVLRVKEREIDPILDELPNGDRLSARLRKVILDQFNEFAELACDVASSGEAKNFWFNDELWEKRFEAIFEGLEQKAGSTNGNGTS